MTSAAKIATLLAAIFVIAASSLYIYDRHTANVRREIAEISIKRWKTMLKLEEAEQNLARWDAGDRDWAVKEWGGMASEIMKNRRFMIGIYKAELDELSP